MERKYLNGASSMAQYKIDNKTIIIIGEIHITPITHITAPIIKKEKCKGIDVNTFILEKLRSENMKLLLEYDSRLKLSSRTNDDIKKTLSSQNMNTLLDKLVLRRFEEKVEGIDIRPTYINSHILYEYQNYDITLIDIFKLFLDPLNLHFSKIFFFVKEKYNTKNVKYLEGYINSKFENLLFINNVRDDIIKKYSDELDNSQIINNSYIKYFIHLLFIIWADVTDFVILKCILKNDHLNKIILIGEIHAKRFKDIFNNENVFYATSNYKYIEDFGFVYLGDNCVDITNH